MERMLGTTRMTALSADLTSQSVGAIVNAANVDLQHGGGVAAALARRAGPSLQAESDAWVAEHGPLEDGTAAVTGAGDLPAAVVVHVAGPVYDATRDDNAARLAATVTAALDAALAEEVRSVAFPAISAGVYGYPRAEATRVLAETAAAWVGDQPDALDEIRLVGVDTAARDDFAAALATLADRDHPPRHAR